MKITGNIFNLSSYVVILSNNTKPFNRNNSNNTIRKNTKTATMMKNTKTATKKTSTAATLNNEINIFHHQICKPAVTAFTKLGREYSYYCFRRANVQKHSPKHQLD